MTSGVVGNSLMWDGLHGTMHVAHPMTPIVIGGGEEPE